MPYRHNLKTRWLSKSAEFLHQVFVGCERFLIEVDLNYVGIKLWLGPGIPSLSSFSSDQWYPEAWCSLGKSRSTKNSPILLMALKSVLFPITHSFGQSKPHSQTQHQWSQKLTPALTVGAANSHDKGYVLEDTWETQDDHPDLFYFKLKQWSITLLGTRRPQRESDKTSVFEWWLFQWLAQ